MSVKCVLITDKSAKIGSLSVNFSEILADCPKNKKYPTIIRLLCLTIIGHFNHGTDFYNYSVAYGLMSARFRTLLIGFRLTTPLSQAPLLGQDELTRRKRDLDTRGLSVRLHTLSKSGFSSHSPYRKQGLPRRDELAFGRPKLAYGLMTARFHTLFWTVPITKLVDSKEKIDRI